MDLYLKREIKRVWWIPVGILYVLVLITVLVAMAQPSTYVQPRISPVYTDPSVTPLVPVCHPTGMATFCTPEAPPPPLDPAFGPYGLGH